VPPEAETEAVVVPPLHAIVPCDGVAVTAEGCPMETVFVTVVLPSFMVQV
jgi:hypothetical protein